MTEGAQYIDVGPRLETDADRRLKEWEDLAEACQSRRPIDEEYPYFCKISDEPCDFGNCFGRRWGWR